jgi:hypothetical protein
MRQAGGKAGDGFDAVLLRGGLGWGDSTPTPGTG